MRVYVTLDREVASRGVVEISAGVGLDIWTVWSHDAAARDPSDLAGGPDDGFRRIHDH